MELLGYIEEIAKAKPQDWFLVINMTKIMITRRLK